MKSLQEGLLDDRFDIKYDFIKAPTLGIEALQSGLNDIISEYNADLLFSTVLPGYTDQLKDMHSNLNQIINEYGIKTPQSDEAIRGLDKFIKSFIFSGTRIPSHDSHKRFIEMVEEVDSMLCNSYDNVDDEFEIIQVANRGKIMELVLSCELEPNDMSDWSDFKDVAHRYGGTFEESTIKRGRGRLHKKITLSVKK